MTQQLTLAHPKHLGIGKHGRAYFLDTLIDVEEHDEEYQRNPEHDLRQDAETEPKRKDRGQYDARQGIRHFHIGVEHGRHERPAAKPESNQDAGNGPDHESKHGLSERDPQVPPDRAFGKPFHDAAGNGLRRGKEEGRQELVAVFRHRRKQVPKSDRHNGDEELKEEELDAGHGSSSSMLAITFAIAAVTRPNNLP